MKYVSLSICSFLISTVAFSQIPEDALKFSWLKPNGTARVQGVGGAMGALGGDVTAVFTNPAGLAFFKTNDFVITPGITQIKTNSNFREGMTEENKSTFNLGTSGFVFGSNNQYNNWNGKAFSIAVTRTANFNNNIRYSGKNDFSSYGEQFASEFAESGLSFDKALQSPDISLQSKLAIYTYLIDTVSIPGNAGQDVVSMSMWDNLKNKAPFLVKQTHNIKTSGGISEIAFGFAATNQDKFYLGGSLGIPVVNYKKNRTFREEDATGNTNNNFSYSELTEINTTKGVGFNFKLGMIYKPATQLRLGLTFHTGTAYALKDTYEATMVTSLEKYARVHTANLDSIMPGTQKVSYAYSLGTPWKLMFSGAYVLSNGEDVKKQKGFITADVEYVNYKSNRYSIADQNGDASYYDDVNRAIKNYYKGAFNFRVGGELKFNTVMARLGFAYYGDPYKDRELKGEKTFVTGGLGYRNKGVFVDVSYVAAMNRDINFPYRLSDKANTFALLKETGGTVAVTTGFKF